MSGGASDASASDTPFRRSTDTVRGTESDFEKHAERDPENDTERHTQKDPSRRDFLKRTAGAVPGAALAGTLGAGACVPDTPDRADSGTGATDGPGTAANVALPEGPLRAVAGTVLPTAALGVEGTERAIRGFVAWVDAFEPAAELDHPYLTGELRYGAAHPAPRWAAQLEAMELESVRRTGASLAERSEEEREALVEEAIRDEGSTGLPGDPARADHVAVGLLAWFYGTSEANDLCYRSEIGRHLCRGTGSLPEEPPPLGEA